MSMADDETGGREALGEALDSVALNGAAGAGSMSGQNYMDNFLDWLESTTPEERLNEAVMLRAERHPDDPDKPAEQE
jgi:hypothetical protein